MAKWRLRAVRRAAPADSPAHCAPAESLPAPRPLREALDLVDELLGIERLFQEVVGARLPAFWLS